MSPRRVLLVPGNVGMTDHYYDFLLGYLFPMALWVRSHPGTPIAVHDCGGRNDWFAMLPRGTDITIVPVVGVLRRVILRWERLVVLRPLDNPRTFRRDELLGFAKQVRDVADVPDGKHGSAVLVVDRSSREGANARRSVPNLGDVAAGLASMAGPVEILDGARMPPSDQIAVHSRARAIVGQHGAGLVNMLWMPTGSTVVEILPPTSRQVRSIYRELAAVLGHSYVSVPQESVHAPVDAGAVVDALRRAPAPAPQTRAVRVRREIYRAGKLTEERLYRVPVVGRHLRRIR